MENDVQQALRGLRSRCRERRPEPVGWVTGRIQRVDGQRLRLVSGARCTELHEGDVIERLDHGWWQRGRIEHSALLGWLWTNERIQYLLVVGDQVRLWEGRRLPPETGTRDNLRGLTGGGNRPG